MRWRARISAGLTGALVLTMSVSSCGEAFWGHDEVLFDGIEFRRKATAVDKSDRKLFETAVRPASASFDAARQAAEYEAIRYCVNLFGSSDIKWEIGPDTDGLTIQDDTLTLRGRCDP